jgi:hypothetical protein
MQVFAQTSNAHLDGKHIRAISFAMFSTGPLGGSVVDIAEKKPQRNNI